ncbi:MAG: PD40 domain-containing protein [Gemmatimonadota bacterium]|nr:MAG: PD40 domain-containing protein [Gemmatimonadota bacterium]
MRRFNCAIIGALVLSALNVPSSATAQTKLLRFPDIHGDRVVFVYAGDLWVAAAVGGSATRLTAHPGLELFPKFSPDGQWIAFTGQYDGDEQVYVIPAAGGVPQQLTYYPARGPLAPRWGFDNQVYGWTGDGSAVLFRSLRGDGWDLTDSRLYTVPREGGMPKALPMPVSGAGDLSPDGGKVVYAPLFRDFRSWKRYEGGWAQDLYIFDLETYETERITDHERADRDPMWFGDRIYFTSDRNGTLNLYSYDPAVGTTAQLTDYTTWDVRWPSADDSQRVVYELNGELVVYDVDAGSSTPISISVPDDGVAMRPSRVSAAGDIEDFELSPKGERALFVARGDVFTAPIEKGPTRNLTRSSGTHDRLARWSPDGAKIAFISDMSGEEELYLINQDGSGQPERLTQGSEARLYRPAWSPDGSHIAYIDKEGRLYVLNVASKQKRQIADEPQGQVTDYTWSPHGGYLAFTLTEPSGFTSVHIYSMAENRLRRVTSELFNQFSPSWDPEGNYLYYLADRELAPQIGSLEWNYVVDRETEIFALALRADVPHPFAPESDEVTIDAAEDGDEDGNGDDEATDEGAIQIDFEGLAERVARVPVDADNYGGLAAVEGHLVYFRGTPFYYGRSPDISPEIHIFSLEDREASTLAEDVSGAALSFDGKKILVQQGGGYNLMDVKPNGGEKKSVSTAGLMVDRVPAEEWEQIFDEVWRRFRDFFYVENMHGYDWEGLREQYRPQLAHVAHRSDLNYVISEMISELNVSHAYIQGGDYEIPERPSSALLGARLELDEASERYRIARIYEGDNHEDRYRSPLMEIGVNVVEGEYILAIDGEELQAPENPYRRLRDRGRHPLKLTVNGRPNMNGAREVTVVPVRTELPLKYYSWVAEKRRQVEEATDGRVGYLHIPDMGSEGIREFIKWYYGQIRKEGLVIDVRGNGGGNVSQMIIRRLDQELLGTRFSRTNDYPGTYPYTVFYGHLVCLISATSASDGDIFPARFRKAGLGPLIGKRTWGGVVGITGHGPLIDGGSVFVPQFGTNDVDGSWIIENYGVAPDIEVENTPKSVLEGRDLQLERGIEEVMRMIRENPKSLPERPAPPVKTK